MARTERQSDRRRREEKWQACWCCRDQQKACRMAQALVQKLEHTRSAEKGKSGLGATEKAIGKYARATFPRGEETEASVQSAIL